jgi:uncharacterized cupredoxin-like copper-binding protein
MRHLRTSALRLAALGSVAAVGLSACSVASKGNDLINGKRQFVAKCGSCHTLAHANTTGVTGPNLDQAFVRDVQDGMKRSTIEGVVHRQIEQPNRRPQSDPANQEDNTAGALMPANLVKGQTALDVAAYVASVAGAPGQDTGRLADIGKSAQKSNATAKNGVLDIPVAAGGPLAFQVGAATAPAGALKIVTKNDGTTMHNIALQGPGVNSAGPVVNAGGTSTISVTLKPGTYTFFCSVPGHREAGMVGKLTVK